MQPVEARRSERVHYRGPVEVSAGEGNPDAEAVHAEALDLGAGGMRISSPLHMEVGAQVTCRVALDGRQAALPGRVAWLAHGDRNSGTGICFDPLGSYESALLQHMVERSRAGYRPVELRFAGMQQTIRARARARTSGLRLSAVLPILARGTELSFQLDEEGPTFTGYIAEATLHEEDGARRIEVEVDVFDRDSVRFRRHTRYGYADEIEAGEQRAANAQVADAAMSSPAGSSSPRERRFQLRPMLLAALVGAAAGWLTGSRSEAPPASRVQVPAAAAAARAETRSPMAPRLPVARPEAFRSLQAPSAQTQQNVSPHDATPSVIVEGDVTRVLLPFEGNLEQMRSTLWAAPYALALALPGGQTSLADGSHALDAGGVGGLRIHRRGDEQLVRLMLSAPIARYSVALENRVLELRVVHSPASSVNP